MNVAEEARVTAVCAAVAFYEEGREFVRRIEVALKDRRTSLGKSLIGFTVR
jgi:hypothetical protein